MAAIDTLTNVTLISTGLYEVTTGVVEVGSNIDDIEDAHFRIHSGGGIRFVNGCTTTFTRCTFHEEDDAAHFGFDNFEKQVDDTVTPRLRPRFWQSTDAGVCAPVFKGCVFIVDTDQRSDFDVGILPLNASPTFEKDEYGNYTRIHTREYCFNHFASSSITIDGLIVDHQGGPSGAYEFRNISDDPNQINDLIIVDNHPSDIARHCVVLINGIVEGGTKTIKRLQARNIALFGSAQVKNVNLIDPIGYIEKPSDSVSSYDGALRVYRTVGANSVFDPANNTEITARAVWSNANTGLKVTEVEGTSYSTELLEYIQPDHSLTVTYDNEYIQRLVAYGYLSQVSNITLESETDPEANVSPVVPMFVDANVTEMNKATVGAYTSIATADQLYDYLHYISVTRNDFVSDIGESLVTVSGNTIDFGDKDVVIDATWPETATHFPSSYVAPTETEGYELSGVVTNTDTALIDDTDPDPSNIYDMRANNMVWKPDGTKLYIAWTDQATDNGNAIVEYTLTTPWDFSTATISHQINGYMHGKTGYISISPDGLTIRWAKRWGRWFQTTMSTPWDLSTIDNLYGQYYSMSKGQSAHWFSDDGTRLWTMGDLNQYGNQLIVFEYSCPTPYSGNGASLVKSRQLASSLSALGLRSGTWVTYDSVNGLEWIENGNVLKVLDCQNGNIAFLEASTPYDIATLEAYDPETMTYIDGPSAPEFDTTSNATTFMWGGSGGGKFWGISHRDNHGPDDTNAGQFEIITFDYNYQYVILVTGEPNTVYIKSTSLNGTDKSVLQTSGIITLENGAGTDMQLVDANGVVTSVTVNGINPNTEVRMYRVSDDTEIGGVENSTGTQASITYTYTTPIDMYIVIHNEQYTTSPRYIEFTTQSAPATLTVFQAKDRAFSNPV